MAKVKRITIPLNEKQKNTLKEVYEFNRQQNG